MIVGFKMFYIGFFWIYWDLDCDLIGFKSKGFEVLTCFYLIFARMIWMSFASKEFRFSNEFGILASKLGMILRFR